MSSNDPVTTADDNPSTILSNTEYVFVYNGVADVVATESQRDGRTGPFADAYANVQIPLRLPAAIARAEQQKVAIAVWLTARHGAGQGAQGGNQGGS
jgi:hypothetical protein